MKRAADDRADHAAPARWPLLRNAGLGVRIAVLSAALAALVIVGTFAALSVQVRRSATRLFADELNRNGRTILALQRDNLRQLVISASLLGESPSLKAALDTYRMETQSGEEPSPILIETVERELEHQGGTLEGGTLLVTDERGRVFAAYARDNSKGIRGIDLSHLPAVRNALDPSLVTDADEAYLSALQIGDTFYRVGVAPLILDGYTIGSIVFGQRVDSATALRLQRDFNGAVVVSAGPRIIASTLPAEYVSPSLLDVHQGGEPIHIGDEEYLAAVVPMGVTQRGVPVKATLLQPLGPAVRGLMSALVTDFLLYGGLGVLLIGLSAALLSRSVLRPLGRFIDFMKQGAARERVEATFEAHDESPEIRALNESFSQLMDSLGGKSAELERRGRELAAANDVLTDEIHERERVERALRESEAQLRQSQKLEAIGTLAGGIAHDFNNMLTVISGFTQMAMRSLGKDHPVLPDLKQVSDAANSAAGLTHQLLAFSRRQVMQPRVLDLNEVVHDMETMIARLVGSHIQVVSQLSEEPVRIKADPGQLEQVLLNLAVNARDAMPSGGTLTITTRRTQRDGSPGVALSVTDDGTGMPAAVRDRIFEPFFTTKEVGKGTGLGLSTVYGIVTQSGGTIAVESVEGKGSTFTVEFPPITEAMQARVEETPEHELPHGTETILVVDDEEAVLDFAQRTLARCGYTVVTATSGVEALTAARLHEGVDLLLTDVLMPRLSGTQLVERYSARYPGACVVYMTGYVDDETMRLDLDEDVVLLRKPFSALELARTVRSALDAHRSPVGVTHA